MKGIDVPHKIPAPQGDDYLTELATIGAADKKEPEPALKGDESDFKKVHGKDGKSQLVRKRTKSRNSSNFLRREK